MPRSSETASSDTNGDAGLTGGQGPTGRTVAAVGVFVALGLFAWTALTVASGQLSVVHVTILISLAALMFGFGQLVLKLLGGLPAWLPPHSTRFVIGFALWTLTATLAAPVVPLTALFWALALAGAVGLGLVVSEHRSGVAHPDAAGMLDLVAIAGALRVATLDNEWLAQTSTYVRFIRHPDLMQHLAMIKQVMLHGAPMRELPFLAGLPSPPYHPAYTSLQATILQALPVPTEAAFFQFLAPAVFAGFAVSVGVAASAIAKRRLAAPLGVAVVLALYGLLGLPAETYGWGVRGVLYFLANPPAALAVVFCAASLALLAAAAEERPTEHLALASVMAAATLVAKANTAIAFAPAFGLVVVIGAVRRWWPVRSAIIASISGVITFLACRWVVGSGDAPIAVRWGAYSRYLIESFTATAERTPLSDLAPVFGNWGPAGEVLMLFAFAALQLLGATLLLLAVWLIPRRTARPSRPVLVGIGLFTLMALLIGMTLVQPGAGRYEAWNISAHTIANIAWLGIALAAAGIALVAPPEGRSVERWVAGTGIALVVAIGLGSLAVNPADNWASYRRVARGYYLLVDRLDLRTTPNDVVAHDAYNDSIMWVSGIGGRRSVLERANAAAASMPREVARRRALIAELISAEDEATAREAAARLGATVVITETDRVGVGLEAIAEELDREGDWVLVRVAPAAQAVEVDSAR